MEQEMDANQITDQVHMIELILGMEEWLKHGNLTKQIKIYLLSLK